MKYLHNLYCRNVYYIIAKKRMTSILLLTIIASHIIINTKLALILLAVNQLLTVTKLFYKYKN